MTSSVDTFGGGRFGGGRFGGGGRGDGMIGFWDAARSFTDQCNVRVFREEGG